MIPHFSHRYFKFLPVCFLRNEDGIFQIVELLKLMNLFKDMYSVVLYDKSNGKNMLIFKQRNLLNCTFVPIRERVK